MNGFSDSLSLSDVSLSSSSSGIELHQAQLESLHFPPLFPFVHSALAVVLPLLPVAVSAVCLMFGVLQTPSQSTSCEVSVPIENVSADSPSHIFASDTAFRSFAIAIIFGCASSRECESALFQIPGQWTTLI